MTKIRSGSQEIEVSNPDKIMFPDSGITKEELVRYYERISDYILPLLKDRPLVMHRYPNGIDDKDFFQKQEPDYFPDWIDTIQIKLREEGRSGQQMVLCNNEATLLYLANQACITPHIWLSTSKDLDKPDKMIFDLDPPEGKFELVKKAAKKLKELCDNLSVPAFVMTTGSDGMHVVIPLDGKVDFNGTRELAKDMVNILAEKYPDEFTVETRKEKRKGRLFLDYLRNSYGQTAVAPYSLRARKNAPVACPLSWDEISNSKLNSRTYTYENIFRRLGRKRDPWRDFSKSASNADEIMKKLSGYKDKL